EAVGVSFARRPQTFRDGPRQNPWLGCRPADVSVVIDLDDYVSSDTVAIRRHLDHTHTNRTHRLAFEHPRVSEPGEAVLLQCHLRVEPVHRAGDGASEDVYRGPVFVGRKDPTEQFTVVATVRGPVVHTLDRRHDRRPRGFKEQMSARRTVVGQNPRDVTDIRVINRQAYPT